MSEQTDVAHKRPSDTTEVNELKEVKEVKESLLIGSILSEEVEKHLYIPPCVPGSRHVVPP